ncbi:MAG: shikimate kinase [Bacteroidota bacterium]|nr:shikimate kinase [Bacteroidota bacterium]
MNRIFLIGYMGSGKTTVGQLLATKLGYSFIDMDTHIESKLFKSVSQIFAELGEQQFRLLEHQCLHEIAEFNNAVISTGGGVPCFFDNMKYMNEHGITIYLKLTAEELTERLEGFQANKRPLLAGKKGKELYQFIAEGLAKREPFYSQATYYVSGEIESMVSEVCEMVKSDNPSRKVL